MKKSDFLNKIGNSKYDYSLLPDIVFSKEKYDIICPEHGIFTQKLGHHINGSGCPKCGFNKISNNKLLTTEEFIKRAQQIHQNQDGTPKYLYNKSKYIDSYKNIKITCKIHGDFEQNPSVHLHGSGCPKCAIIKNSEKRKLTTEEFIKRAQQVHQNLDGTPKYLYNKSKYIDSYSKVIITCPIHGDFEQQANSHLMSTGCPKCAKIKITTEEFIKRAQQIHQNSEGTPKYLYNKSKYKCSAEKLIITCPIHGDFEQTPFAHLQGQGCRLCYDNKQKITTEEFIKRAQQIHQNSDGTPKYLYNKSKYTHSEEKLIITCPIHGDFEQKAYRHLQGCGCQICAKNLSKKEAEIHIFLKQNNIKFNISDRQIITPQELDIYIPEKKIGIEYDGLYWHSELYKSNNYHLQKTIDCEKQGIQLIHIFEDEWLYKQDIIKARLLNLFSKNKWSIGARKCKIKQVPIEEERQFLNNNHLQGYVASIVCYGLYWIHPKTNKEYLVALMSFGPLRKNLGSSNKEGCYELYRFVTAKNFSIPGGASRLFKYFIMKFSPKQVTSFADRRWSIKTKNKKNLYEQLGFRFDSYTEPGYFYVQGDKRINRFSLRKDVLIQEYGCSPEQSEHKFCQEKGWPRIYDSGQLKYVWFSPNIQE